MSEKYTRLVSFINESDGAKIKRSKKDFIKLRDRLFKAKTKEIRKGLYKIENEKIKQIEKNLLKLEKNFSKLKKYYDYDDIEYKGIRDVKNLFDLSIDKSHYKPIKTNDCFNSNQIEYESKEDKNKTLSVKKYLNIIRSYLREIINGHKTQGEWKVHAGNTVIDYKIKGEWKIQLKRIFFG